MAVDKWPVVSDEIRQKMARMAAAAAWGLGKKLLTIILRNRAKNRLIGRMKRKCSEKGVILIMSPAWDKD